MGKAAWVLVVAAISPLNYDYDDSVKTLRFVQFLNQTIEVEMGANVKTERGRRLWQSRVNLQMLARIKKVRQARQGSDNMMKKLGTVLKIPVRPKNPARNARLHASMTFMTQFRKSRRKLAIQAVDTWRNERAVKQGQHEGNKKNRARMAVTT